jgi:hypothetical protein
MYRIPVVSSGEQVISVPVVNLYLVTGTGSNLSLIFTNCGKPSIVPAVPVTVPVTVFVIFFKPKDVRKFPIFPLLEKLTTAKSNDFTP